MVKRFPVDVDNLHVDDWVWWSDRRMRVLAVNREERRVLVGGRKHSCKNCDIRWVEENKLGTRPRKLAGRLIRSILEVDAETAEAIEWVPSRNPIPTQAAPGTTCKIAVLRSRVERGEHLFAPGDNDHSGYVGASSYGDQALTIAEDRFGADEPSVDDSLWWVNPKRLGVLRRALK
jgi:hypothetical protein